MANRSPLCLVVDAASGEQDSRLFGIDEIGTVSIALHMAEVVERFDHVEAERWHRLNALTTPVTRLLPSDTLNQRSRRKLPTR
ncbi:unnamed protein product [Phytophthora lilii]|uniref:Unnamed protein product n=1 Tax=Phytophthora lilii TaxID=2077276 RepID=A0A9W6TAQ0_9STRA|nr:unnamed protein product [Phytophthora lilii]